VIAPGTAFLTDDLVGAGAGVAVEPRDTTAFAAVLRGIMDDDDRTAAMSRAAFAMAGTIALSPDQWIDRLLARYAGRIGDAQSQIARAIA
jgi:hypothetical protein